MFSISITKKDSRILSEIQTILFEKEKKYYYKKQLLKRGLERMEKDEEFRKKVEECVKSDTENDRERIALWIDEEMKLQILKLRDKYNISQTKLISCVVKTLYYFERVGSVNPFTV